MIYPATLVKQVEQPNIQESHAVEGDAAKKPGLHVICSQNPPLAVLADMDLFVDSLVDVGAVGGSIYDWATTGDAARTRLAELFAERGIG